MPKRELVAKVNYESLMIEINESLQRWMSLPMSIIGRIIILKSNILPKLLYLFQNIPLPPPSDLFSRIKKIFVEFIWNNRKTRLRLSLLYLPFDRGGLKCPNLMLHYWATQLRSMTFYFSTNDSPHWTEVESYNLNFPLPLFIYSDTVKKFTETS